MRIDPYAIWPVTDALSQEPIRTYIHTHSATSSPNLPSRGCTRHRRWRRYLRSSSLLLDARVSLVPRHPALGGVLSTPNKPKPAALTHHLLSLAPFVAAFVAALLQLLRWPPSRDDSFSSLLRLDLVLPSPARPRPLLAQRRAAPRRLQTALDGLFRPPFSSRRRADFRCRASLSPSPSASRPAFWACVRSGNQFFPFF